MNVIRVFYNSIEITTLPLSKEEDVYYLLEPHQIKRIGHYSRIQMRYAKYKNGDVDTWNLTIDLEGEKGGRDAQKLDFQVSGENPRQFFHQFGIVLQKDALGSYSPISNMIRNHAKRQFDRGTSNLEDNVGERVLEVLKIDSISQEMLDIQHYPIRPKSKFRLRMDPHIKLLIHLSRQIQFVFKTCDGYKFFQKQGTEEFEEALDFDMSTMDWNSHVVVEGSGYSLLFRYVNRVESPTVVPRPMRFLSGVILALILSVFSVSAYHLSKMKVERPLVKRVAKRTAKVRLYDIKKPIVLSKKPKLDLDKAFIKPKKMKNSDVSRSPSNQANRRSVNQKKLVSPKVAVKPKVSRQKKRAIKPKSGLNSSARKVDINSIGLLGQLKDQSEKNRVSADRVVKDGLINRDVALNRVGKVKKVSPSGLLAKRNDRLQRKELSRAATKLESSERFDIRSNTVISSNQGRSSFSSDASANGAGAFNSQVTFGKTIFRGGLSESEVMKGLSPLKGSIRICYESTLVLQPQVQGKMTFNWRINGDGRVSQVGKNRGGIDSSSLESCISNILRKASFPRSKNGTVTSVEYTFEFKRTQ